MACVNIFCDFFYFFFYFFKNKMIAKDERQAEAVVIAFCINHTPI